MVDAKPIALLNHGNEVSRIWHERFSHLNVKYFQQLQKNSMFEGLSIIKATTRNFKGCVVGKQPEHKFDRGKANWATCILGLIHSDISGLIPVTSMNGSMYLLTFIDDFSRYTWVFFIKKTSEALVQNEELATRWLKILVTIGFSSDLLLNMSNFDWTNYKRLKLTTSLVIC